MSDVMDKPNALTGKLFDLAGKVAVITGSSRGIGKAIAEQMAAHGAKVVISSRKAGPCEEVAAAINARSAGHAIAVPANISSKEDLQRLMDETRKEFGKIDILVCNAASNPFYGSQLDIGDDAFSKILSNNIIANNWMIGMVAPEMKERKDGSIIIVSSIGGLRGSEVIGAYCISKAADMQLARNLARELGPSEHPGELHRARPREDRLRQGALGHSGRRGTRQLRHPTAPPGRARDDLAGIAVYLGSRAGAWTTGQTFVVDGGSTC